MSRVIMFARVYPAYHPKKTEPTDFVEKLWKSFELQNLARVRKDFSEYGMTDCNYRKNYSVIIPKHTTVRKGNRWKVGDKFSPRAWSGKPYRSKQIILAQDIEVKKVWEVEIAADGTGVSVWIKDTEGYKLQDVARNDGLSCEDFIDWFNVKPDKPFNGQIICWNEKIIY